MLEYNGMPLVVRTYRGYHIVDNTIGTVFIVQSDEIIDEVASIPEARSLIDYWITGSVR